MKLKMFGISYHTAPVEIREKFAFDNTKLVTALHYWNDTFDEGEAVLVSTCNRTELYIGTPNGSLPDNNAVFEFLAHDRTSLPSNWQSSFQVLETEEAVEHLFTVVSSLNSMVVGEPQILAQVKNAYQTAATIGSAGTITHALFQHALRTAKRISVDTELFKHRISIPSIAVVDFALTLFEKLDNKKTLVLGAGEMAQETLRYLVDHGTRSILIINRSREKAEELAREWNAAVDDWTQIFARLDQTDLLITATGAQEPILTNANFQASAVKRRGRPLFILDLALPRNVDPEIGKLPDVYLYSIDDLKETCRKNCQKRDREIPKVQKIIRQETELFLQEMRRRDSDDVIRQLRQTWNSIKKTELDRLLRKCTNLDSKTEDEIRYSFDRLVNKLLHPPMESLKDEIVQEDSPRFLELIRRLFRL